MRRSILAGVVVVLLGVPAAAHAEITYCVANPGCVGTDVPGPATGATIQAAIDAAAGSAGPDNISLGPATFTGVNVASGPGNELTVFGVSRDATVLRGGAATNGVVSLAGGIDRVTGLSVVMTTTGDPSSFGLRLFGGTIEGVAVRSEPGVDGTGVRLGTNAGMTVTTVALDAGTGRSTTAVSAGAGSTVTASSLSAATGVVNDGTSGVADVSLNELSIAATRAIRQEAQGSIVLGNSEIRIAPGGAAGLPTALLAQNPSGGAGSPATIDARHVTIVGDGSAGSTGLVAATGIGAHATRTATVKLRDSIVRGVDFSVNRAGGNSAANIDVDFSNLSEAPADVSSAGTGSFVTSTANIDADPRFLSASDARLRADSPGIDRGDPAAGGSTTDLAVLPRVRDGNGDGTPRRDMGAFEYQRLAPSAGVITAVTGPLSATFTATSFDQDAGEATALTYAWSFDDGTTATGAVVSKTFATAGAHTGTLTVTDPAGLTASASGTVTFPTPPGVPIAPVTPPPSPPLLDGAAPVLRSFRASPGTIVAGTALPTTAATRTRTTLSYSSTEAGRATLAFDQIATGRRVGGRCVRGTRSNRTRPRCTRYVRIPAAASLAARAGTNRIAFTGRVTRSRTLKPARYRLTLTARDAAGNTSRPATTTLTIKRRPR